MYVQNYKVNNTITEIIYGPSLCSEKIHQYPVALSDWLASFKMKRRHLNYQVYLTLFESFSGPSVAPVPSAGIRAPLSSLEKIGLGAGRKEKAFATLVHDAGRVPDETHLPADARQELHAEPIDVNKQKSEGISKSQPLGFSLQGLNPAFAKISSAKDSNALPESKKGVETTQQQRFKPFGTVLVKGVAKEDKKPTVAPGMKR